MKRGDFSLSRCIKSRTTANGFSATLRFYSEVTFWCADALRYKFAAFVMKVFVTTPGTSHLL